MPIYDLFDREELDSAGSSAKESLTDIGQDQEERDKIEHKIDESFSSIKLRVDYSKFEEHVFFGSAEWAIKFALSRIADTENGYPWSGELKEKNAWRSKNTDFENWWFDNEYPHQFGYLVLHSGSGDAWVESYDALGHLNPLTQSVTIESIISPHPNYNQISPIFTYASASLDNGFAVYLTKSGDDKELHFAVYSGSASSILTASYNAFISSSTHVAAVWDNQANEQRLYFGGALQETKNVSAGFERINARESTAYVGKIPSGLSTFSGSIDEVRYWVSARPAALIQKNFARSIHAHHSGGLKLYYKFNEVSDVNSETFVIDYSGYENHGTITSSAVSQYQRLSGTLGPWFKTVGDPIFNRANLRVSASLEKWFVSGSLYDRGNSNFIYNLVPSFFINDEPHEQTRLFLLVLGRHYDKIKLYTKHLAHILHSDEGGYNIAPDELLSTLARNYGITLAGVFDSANPLQYYFGEGNIQASGSADSSIEEARNQLRRNLVNNLAYIIKTKSTVESIRASLRTLGLDEDIVNINEYSQFSGGIQTTYTPKVVERRTANFLTSSNVFIDRSVYSTTEPRTYQFRTRFFSGSTFLTSSLFTISDNGGTVFYLQAERQNLSSANAVYKLYHSGATEGVVSSSALPAYDGEWTNFTLYRGVPGAGSRYGMNVSRLLRDDIQFHFSGSVVQGADAFNPTNSTATVISLGSSGSYYFSGAMQEFRAWNKILSSSTLVELHTKDFESLAVENVFTDVASSLLSHLKLNDFTGSATGGGPIHDYLDGLSGSSYFGFASASHDAFPGEFIYKLEPSYSYDFGINNEKIRIRNDAKLNKADEVKSIPFLSVDVSPVVSLNKEIVRWFGDLSGFNNIIGKPMFRYQDVSPELDAYRNKFFSARISRRLNFSAYYDFLKWFDTNFTNFLRQLVPIDVINSLSNFVIEPHIFEYNKVIGRPSLGSGTSSDSIEATITATPMLTASRQFHTLEYGDPGRWGAAASASAEVSADAYFNYTQLTGSGVGYSRLAERAQMRRYLVSSSSVRTRSYGNGYYSIIITGANYLKNTYGVITDFESRYIHYDNDSTTGLYLSSAWGAPQFSSSVSGNNYVMDQRWLYGMQPRAQEYRTINVYAQDHDTFSAPSFDAGIKYGGGFGQLPFINHKSINTNPQLNIIDGNGDPVLIAVDADTPLEFAGRSNSANRAYGAGIGYFAKKHISNFQPTVEVVEVTENGKLYTIWPNSAAWNGVNLAPAVVTSLIVPVWEGTRRAKAIGFGEIVNIDGNNTLQIHIHGQVTKNASGNVGLTASIKFQFFNTDFPSDTTFESQISSSVEADEIKKVFVPRVYEFNQGFGSSVLEGEAFHFSFERPLPKAKYMRPYIIFKYADDDTNRFPFRVKVSALLTSEKSNLEPEEE